MKNQSLLYSRYYALACNEWWGSSLRLSAWAIHAAPKIRRKGGEPLRTLCQFDRPGNRTPDLPHR